MGDVLTFVPRPRPPETGAEVPQPMTEAEIRERLGTALRTALDAADHIIAVLDRMDGDSDLEDGADAEPSLAAPENPGGSQVAWTRGGDGDCEAGAPDIALPVVVISPAPRIRVNPEPAALPWAFKGSMVSAAAITLFDFVVGEG